MIAPFVGETAASQKRLINGVWHEVMCTQAAAGMCIAWADPNKPATIAGTIALYNASGHGSNGGTTQAQLLAEIQAVHGRQPEPIHSYADALAHLRDGYRLCVAGNYSWLPKLSGFLDGAFHANPEAWHEVAVGPIQAGQETAADPLVWWADPLRVGPVVHRPRSLRAVRRGHPRIPERWLGHAHP
jgi:hypothetical protein